MRPRYKHIVWDWNGTLVNDSWLAVDVMNQTLARRNMQLLDLATYQKIFCFPVKDYYKRLGFDFIEESFEVVGTEFMKNYEARKFEIGLHARVEQVLTQLSTQGIKHSILSAYKQEYLEELVAHLDVGKHFNSIIGLDNHYAHSKVERGVQWLKNSADPASEILFIGDTEHDYEVAEAMGVASVLISRGHQSREILEATGAAVLDSISDVIEYCT